MFRSVLSLFFWVFICGGIVLSLFVARKVILYRGSEDWPVTTGVVTMSALTHHYFPPDYYGYEARRSDGWYVHKASIEYEYTVDGRSYRGTRVGTPGKGVPQHLTERFPKGKAVPVYYDESHPGRALLIPGLNVADIKIRLGMCGAILILGLIGLWWTTRW